MAGLFGLGTTKKRRSSSGGGGKMLDTVLAVGAIGGIAVVGYFVLRSGKGVDEALDSFGDAVKSTIDAASSGGDWIADGSYWLQDKLGIGNTPGGRGEEKNIIDKLKGKVKSDQEVKKEKYAKDWGPLAQAVDSTGEFFGNKACHAMKIFNPSLRCG